MSEINFHITKQADYDEKIYTSFLAQIKKHIKNQNEAPNNMRQAMEQFEDHDDGFVEKKDKTHVVGIAEREDFEKQAYKLFEPNEVVMIDYYDVEKNKPLIVLRNKNGGKNYHYPRPFAKALNILSTDMYPEIYTKENHLTCFCIKDPRFRYSDKVIVHTPIMFDAAREHFESIQKDLNGNGGDTE